MYEKTNQCMYVSGNDERDQYVFICGAGSENETEQETGIEQESETQAEEAVDPMSADRLLMRARDFRPSEILEHILVKESGMKR